MAKYRFFFQPHVARPASMHCTLELKVPVVTDAQVMPTLELLKIMLECGHTDMKTIKSLCEYWRQFGDRPANLEADFKRLFPDR